MCIVFLIVNEDQKESSKDKIKSILCHGRDEVLSRPTIRAHQWKDIPNIFAGRDQIANGTVRSFMI